MLRAGIVGLPNVGKSTLFNALTRTRKAESANYPFCTIDPNVGVVMVPDARLKPLAAIEDSAEIIPAAVEFVDIAGLVAGASQGEGMGNQFLSHIREVDAVVQVVRCFEDSEIHHVAGNVDPVRDIETITTELILADLDSLRRQMPKLEKDAKRGDKEAAAKFAFAQKLEPHLNAEKPAITFELEEEEQPIAKSLFLLIGPIQFLKSILPTSKHAMVTRDDVAAMADLGEIEGALQESEETVIHNLLRLRDITVDEEMTPRVVVNAFEVNQTIKEILDENTILRFSRIPVYEETIDNIKGLVIRSEILMAASRDEWDLTLNDLMKPVHTIKLGKTIEDALNLFLGKKQQFALVKDEFGGTSGIITMEDVMETLLGKEIIDELDEVEDMRELARNHAAQSEEE